MDKVKRKRVALSLLVLDVWMLALVIVSLALIAHFRQRFGLTEEGVATELFIMVPTVHVLLIGINLAFLRRNIGGTWMIVTLLAFILHSVTLFLCLGTDGKIVWNDWTLFPYTLKTTLAYMEMLTVSLPFAFVWVIHGAYFFDEFCCQVRARRRGKQPLTTDKDNNALDKFINDHKHEAHKIVDSKHVAKLQKLMTMDQKLK